MAVALDPLEPGLRRPVLARGDDRARRGQPAVGAGTDAHIIAVAPSCEIVAAGLPRPGVVGHLVGGKAGGGQHLLGCLVERRRRVRPGQRQLAASVAGVEGGAGLDGELIGREVAACMGEGAPQLVPPVGEALAGPGIDQVEGEAREYARRHRHRRQRLARRMAAAEEPERGVVQGLHAEAHPVDPGLAIGFQPRRLDRGGVGLECDFEI